MAVLPKSEWNITNGSFKTVKFHVAIPAPGTSSFGMMSQDVQNERRLQISERPLVDGADVEDFGRKPRNFTAEVIFFGRNYDSALKEFEDILNEGSSGQLILPDLSTAVFAKYRSHTRKTSASEGNSTILSVSWIEDRKPQNLTDVDRSLDDAVASAKKDDLQSAAPVINDKIRALLDKINESNRFLDLNPYLNAISAAEKSITNATVSGNGVINLAANSKANVLNALSRMSQELTRAAATAKGLLDYVGLLSINLNQPKPTRFNTGAGAVDGLAPDVTRVSTQVIPGTSTVVKTVTPVTPIQSFPIAVSLLVKSVTGIGAARVLLENATQGATADVSVSSIQLINTLKDLLKLLNPPAPIPVLVTSRSSLLEICFRNGLDVSQIERVYKLNSGLDDILDIPAGTVVNL